MAKATREAYGEALKRLAVDNPDIVVLDADLSGSTKTSEFKKVSPERFFNVGIAEQNLIGTAAGLALAGKIPFASSFAMFAAGRAFEIIRNTVAYPGLNELLRIIEDKEDKRVTLFIRTDAINPALSSVIIKYIDKNI